MSDTIQLMILVGVFLAFVYIVAMLTKNSKRKTERAQLEADLRARQEPAPAQVVPDPAPAEPYLLPPPPVVPAAPTPRPKALLAWAPPAAADPPQFRQYITWPGTKLSTPVAERTPSEKDYVWD